MPARSTAKFVPCKRKCFVLTDCPCTCVQWWRRYGPAGTAGSAKPRARSCGTDLPRETAGSFFAFQNSGCWHARWYARVELLISAACAHRLLGPRRHSAAKNRPGRAGPYSLRCRRTRLRPSVQGAPPAASHGRPARSHVGRRFESAGRREQQSPLRLRVLRMILGSTETRTQ